MFPGLQLPARRSTASSWDLSNGASETSSKEPVKCFRRSKVNKPTESTCTNAIGKGDGETFLATAAVAL